MVCNDARCAFRNRLFADDRLATPSPSFLPVHIPIFGNPSPPPNPTTILRPPPPLAPVPPPLFHFPPRTFSLPATPTYFPMPDVLAPMLPPAPMPPGPFIPSPEQTAPALPAPLSQPPPPPWQDYTLAASPDPKKSPSVGSVMREQNVHTFKPKKGPIPQADRDALFDFEERTRHQEYRDLAESSKQQFSPKPEAARRIFSIRQITTGQRRSFNTEEAIRRAHRPAHGKAAPPEPAAIVSNAINHPPPPPPLSKISSTSCLLLLLLPNNPPTHHPKSAVSLIQNSTTTEPLPTSTHLRSSLHSKSSTNTQQNSNSKLEIHASGNNLTLTMAVNVVLALLLLRRRRRWHNQMQRTVSRLVLSAGESRLHELVRLNQLVRMGTIGI